MDKISSWLFLNNWQRKLVAIIIAMIIWVFVNNSIVDTKTIPNVAVKVTNIPLDKTIIGLSSNGMLSKRVTLTLSGTKDIIQELEPGDLEVLLDASMANSDDWDVQISKKNLISLNPEIDLLHHITQVGHSELILKISPLITSKIPITIMPPAGESPPEYEFLDIWPQRLLQTITGPEEEVKIIKAEGIELTFNLSEIQKEELDNLKSAYKDEVSFPVPDKWKKIEVPCHNYLKEDLNDPQADHLHIDFLRKQFSQIGKEIPIRVFYPLKYADKINPKTYPLLVNDQMHQVQDVISLTIPLYVRDVSKLFLDIVTDNLEITIVASPTSERAVLRWSLDIVDAHELEDVFVAFHSANSPESKDSGSSLARRHEAMLRNRFREYARRLQLYKAPDQKFQLDSRLEANGIKVSLTG